MINLTFPYGGYGTILSEGVLRNIFRSIQCPPGFFDGKNKRNTTEEDFRDVRACNRLKEDNVGELKYFTNGMNMAELMYKYTSTEKYRDVSQWNHTGGGGFCMHSDWVIGYFMNYYNMSRHVTDPFYKDVPHSRIEAYKGSEIYGMRKTGFCKQDGREDCDNGSEICHRVSPEWMEQETRQFRLKFPSKFRNQTTT
jgi:hypothetical protein